MKSQIRSISPPLESDKTLSDYTEVIQGNFRDLFQYAHTHSSVSTVPSNDAGQVGDILIVLVSTTYYLYVKVAANVWKRVALS